MSKAKGLLELFDILILQDLEMVFHHFDDRLLPVHTYILLSPCRLETHSIKHNKFKDLYATPSPTNYYELSMQCFSCMGSKRAILNGQNGLG